MKCSKALFMLVLFGVLTLVAVIGSPAAADEIRKVNPGGLLRWSMAGLWLIIPWGLDFGE